MIRLATLEDTPRILELFNSDDFLRGSEDDFYTADDIRQYLSINVRRIYLYDRDSKIVGAVCLDLMTICREIFVFLLIVDKAWQGRGIGQELMDHVERLAAEHGIILLSSFTETGNGKMRHVFEKHGYAKGKEFLYYSKNPKPPMKLQHKTKARTR